MNALFDTTASSQLITDGLLRMTLRFRLNLWATAHGRILYSFNIADFFQLHSGFLAQGRFGMEVCSISREAMLQ